MEWEGDGKEEEKRLVDEEEEAKEDTNLDFRTFLIQDYPPESCSSGPDQEHLGSRWAWPRQQQEVTPPGPPAQTFALDVGARPCNLIALTPDPSLGRPC